MYLTICSRLSLSHPTSRYLYAQSHPAFRHSVIDGIEGRANVFLSRGCSRNGNLLRVSVPIPRRPHRFISSVVCVVFSSCLMCDARALRHHHTHTHKHTSHTSIREWVGAFSHTLSPYMVHTVTQIDFFVAPPATYRFNCAQHIINRLHQNASLRHTISSVLLIVFGCDRVCESLTFLHPFQLQPPKQSILKNQNLYYIPEQ